MAAEAHDPGEPVPQGRRRHLKAAMAAGGVASLAALLLGQPLVVPTERDVAVAGIVVLAPDSSRPADTTTGLRR